MFSFFFDLKKIQKIQLYLAFWYHSVVTLLIEWHINVQVLLRQAPGASKNHHGISISAKSPIVFRGRSRDEIAHLIDLILYSPFCFYILISEYDGHFASSGAIVHIAFEDIVK